ncbi:MAG TPA: glycosyltransferase family 2 protein [Tepidisphaeraceae bacterium]|nr:glycosyltransferase family 2 protein [Tepidisphaeraceae bacterium]
MSRVAVVIVNYRTADLTIDCLRSLAPEVTSLNGGVTVTVTDNLSGDDSVAKLTAAVQANGWSAWARILPLPRNGGFAYGNNEGIRPALAQDPPPDYVLLLNPDTVVRPGGLKALVDFMDANPTAGLAGSRLEDPDGPPQRSAFRFHSVLSEWEHGLRLGVVSKLLERHVVAPDIPSHDAAVRTDWVAGASMIVRRQVFEAIGLLDERYFMYFEEADFCLRAARAGWPCWYVPASRVVHLVGQASGVTNAKLAVKKRRPQYWFDARRRYFLSNHGRLKTVAADVGWALGYGVFRVRRVIQRKPDTEPRLMLWDFVRYNFLGGRRA